MQAVRVLRDGALHPVDSLRLDFPELVHDVHGAISDEAVVKVESGSLNPTSPVPRPLQALTRVEEDRDAAEEKRIDGRLVS